MIKVIWRSDPVCNPVGMEARIIDLNGEQMLEVVIPRLKLPQKLKAIWNIITGKEYILSTIYGEMPNEQ